MSLDDRAAPQLSILEFESVRLDPKGNVSKRDRTSASLFTEWLGDGVALNMIQIQSGIGQVGSPISETARSNDEELRSVQLQSFFISQFPITQAQWRTVAALPKVNHPLRSEPACFKGANRPVEQVSWFDAVEFCARLTQATGRSYRLPTEAEWEYACRAGTTTPFYFGETLSTDWANYCGEDHSVKGRTRQGKWLKGSYGDGRAGIDRKQTTEVEHFKASNAFGLYDMHGNVWEWCTHDSDDEVQPLRGGSWKSSPSVCRSASRWLARPGAQESFIGFRVVYALTDDRRTARSRLPQPRTILFLASSPTDRARLRQDKEIREIKLGLERAKLREQFRLDQGWAVRAIDLRRALLDYKPQILHFSGHGGGAVGLVLEDQSGMSAPVSATALASLLQQFSDRGLECVVLNACFSDTQASAIVQHIPYLIGMSDAIGDTAAIEFAIGFYDAIGAGWTYEEAFEMGKTAILFEGIPEEAIPTLRKKPA